MDKRTVLVLTSTFPRWAEDAEPRFVYDLSRCLKSDFRIIVLAPHCPGAKRAEMMDGMEVIRFRYAPEPFELLAYNGGIPVKLRKSPWMFLLVPFFIVGQFWACSKIMKAHRISLLHAHWLIPQAFIATIVNILLRDGAPVLCTLHGADLYTLNGSFGTWLQKWILSRCHGISVVSSSMKRILQTLVGNQLMEADVMPMGVDTDTFFAHPLDEVRKKRSVIFVGRLVEKKGVRYFIEAARILQASGETYSFSIIGDGPERPVLEALVRKHGLQNEIRFYGSVPHGCVARLLVESEFFVMPSVTSPNGDREGLGLTLIEAMCCGCLAIASDYEAVHDIITNGINGFIVPQRNPAAIASIIRECGQNESRMNECRKNGRASIVERFSWPVVAKRYQKKYLAMMRQNADVD